MQFDSSDLSIVLPQPGILNELILATINENIVSIYINITIDDIPGGDFLRHTRTMTSADIKAATLRITMGKMTPEDINMHQTINIL